MSEKLKMRLGIKELTILILIVSFAFFYFTYNWIGLRLFIGSLLLFFVPFYIFLDSFDLAVEEKLIFSFFIGIGVVPVLVFYFTRILVSLRLSMLVCFILLIIGSLVFRKFYKKNK